MSFVFRFVVLFVMLSSLLAAYFYLHEHYHAEIFRLQGCEVDVKLVEVVPSHCVDTGHVLDGHDVLHALEVVAFVPTILLSLITVRLYME